MRMRAAALLFYFFFFFGAFFGAFLPFGGGDGGFPWRPLAALDIDFAIDWPTGDTPVMINEDMSAIKSAYSAAVAPSVSRSSNRKLADRKPRRVIFLALSFSSPFLHAEAS